MLEFMNSQRFAEGKPVGEGALARRFYDTGTLAREPQLVPAGAWIEGMGANTWIHEHTMQNSQPGTVLTMLWVPGDPDAPREIGLSPSMVPFLCDT